MIKNLEIPNIQELLNKILPVKSSFVGDFIHPALGKTKIQTIEEWRIAYLDELKLNNEMEDIGKFNVFITSLLLRSASGESGGKLYDALTEYIKNFDDINSNNIKIILKKAGYRFPNQGLETILSFKKLFLGKYHNDWNSYLEQAKKYYKSNFLEDEILKIKGVGLKVRDLALSCFLKEYSANDFHVVDVLVRTGLVVSGYGDVNFGTNPNNENNYLFLRNLIVKLSEQSGYSPGELDRIFWHFGRALCKRQPLCCYCPINCICLTYKDKK